MPFYRTVGNQARPDEQICESKGGENIGTGMVVWRGNREKKLLNWLKNSMFYFKNVIFQIKIKFRFFIFF